MHLHGPVRVLDGALVPQQVGAAGRGDHHGLPARPGQVPHEPERPRHGDAAERRVEVGNQGDPGRPAGKQVALRDLGVVAAHPALPRRASDRIARAVLSSWAVASGSRPVAATPAISASSIGPTWATVRR